MTLMRQENPIITTVKTTLSDALVPVINALSQPAIVAQRMKQNAIHWNYTYEENAKLRAENEKLLKWQNLALRLEAENKSLRSLFQLEALPPLHYVSARIVGTRAGSLEHSLMLALPADHQVRLNQAVVSERGLVGRISEVGKRSATVLLITDSNARIPVISERSRLKAMLSGDNSKKPLLNYLPDNQFPERGERIITSDDGQVFPAGIPVGEAIVDKEHHARVLVFAKLASLEYVLIATQEAAQ